MMVFVKPIKVPIIEQVKHAKIAAGNPYPQAQQVNGGIRSIFDYIAEPRSEVIGNHRLSSGIEKCLIMANFQSIRIFAISGRQKLENGREICVSVLSQGITWAFRGDLQRMHEAAYERKQDAQ